MDRALGPEVEPGGVARGAAPRRPPARPPARRLVDGAGRLTGVHWPLRVRPEPDELLTSWVARLAACYGVSPARFLATIIRPPERPRNVDWALSDGSCAVLAEKTGAAPDLVAALRLDGALAWWRMPADGKSTRHRVQPALVYCPSCLTDGSPYLRRAWRLGCSTVCPRHARALLDRCPKCAAGLVVPSERHEAPDVTRCHGCGHDLRRVDAASDGIAIPSSDVTTPAPAELVAQARVNAAVRGDPLATSGLGRIGAGTYLTYLRGLFRLVVAGPKLAALWPALSTRYGVAYPLPPVPNAGGRIRPWSLALADRRRAITLLTQLLHDWPAGIAEIMTAGRVRELAHVLAFAMLPPELHRALEQHLGGDFTRVR